MTSLLSEFDISEERIRRLVADTLHGADDGELFLEHSQSESLMFDNGRLKTASFNTDRGFGLRAVAGEATGYAHSSELSHAALLRASDAVSTVKNGHQATLAEAPSRTNHHLYSDENPIPSPGFDAKAKLLQDIDAYARNADPRVRQVTASLASSWQHVEILRGDGQVVHDIRPMVRMNISVVVGDGERQESGSYGMGGRKGFDDFLSEESWQYAADEALRQALVNLEAAPAPAGTFDIVLANGWPGVMLHEAVGHGLEGDFNRKKASAFSGLMGEQVAAKGITVVDDGTFPERRGSITVDDEGTPSAHNVLIEDGRLVNYMQDRQNARLMNMKATGNGRRQGYAYRPMPRMTNTFMMSGDKTPEEIITSVKNGIYAVSFGGGQVDITSGKFVFGCTEAYMIEDGKVTRPIKGAMLIGNGPDAMHRISMVGNDMKLDTGVGNCGKAGQWVPVGVGQPHLRMDQMTVGGTQL
ncbi:metalloprotease TldD [Aquamicrobium segne]|uniref:Metalloprotease TldD n=1 Tax=Aquamicrobium segne TaxID=469547 RepID=A0ABW0GUC5_9HYPH